MLRSLQKYKLNSGGFTLLEILVVVIILGVLASLALPVYNASAESVVRQEALMALGALRDSEQRYFAGKNTYTSAVADLDYDPSTVAAGAVRHFDYSVTAGATGITASFTANATRNTVAARPGGSAYSGALYTITINQTGIPVPAQSGSGS